MINDRIVLRAVLHSLEAECVISEQASKIAQLEAERDKINVEYEKLKAENRDPQIIKNKFFFFVENGVFPEYYE